MDSDGFDLLDQLSTSQKFSRKNRPDSVSSELWHEAIAAIEEREIEQEPTCQNGAPCIFYQDAAGLGHVVSGCCNNWMCRRCGLIRAKHEYGRIVDGCTQLANRGCRLYFITVTCRGSDLSVKDADETYYAATNRLLSSCRYRAKQQSSAWHYVQVTERQKRGHPHSHIISTFCPSDASAKRRKRTRADGRVEWRDVLSSHWFQQRSVSAGLGKQYEITPVRNPIAVAVYVAKYLFKDSMATEFPKGWKRVRYSQSFPKLEKEKAAWAMPLVTRDDWREMALQTMARGVKVVCEDEYAAQMAMRYRMTFALQKQHPGQRNAGYIAL